MRHHHAFTDEDSMKWLKALSRNIPGIGRTTFEQSVMRKSRLRLLLTACYAAKLCRTSVHRSER